MKDFLQEKGYKKSGKLYTPPILQLGDFNAIDWTNELIPELFWIGVLQDKFGFNDGSNIASTIVTSALDVSCDKSIWFAPVSSFNHFSLTEKTAIKDQLKIVRLLPKLQECFVSIVTMYPEFPLSFLIEPSSARNIELKTFKKLLNDIFDRTSIPANLIQGVSLDMIFRSEVDFKIGANTTLAEFPKFVEYPSTEISKQVASSIRSAINTLYSYKEINRLDNVWPTYFWNRGLEIEKCY